MRALLPLVLLAALLGAGRAAAQSGEAQVSFGGVRQDPTLPVEVTSEELAIDQEDGTATFTGDVLVTQGALRLTAPRLRVVYSEDRAGIEEVHATGGVTLVNGPEAAESREATYTVGSGAVVMTGDVLLTQGEAALSGDALEIDLVTGTGRMRGRVRSLFRTDGR
jgi:lipopolysaccharide export system protein LptA